MYWDIVEAVPEPDHFLFVRFKDGLSGRIHIWSEELTGALAPLRETSFLGHVFIDQGAVAWPSDIDLAPDALYHQVVSDPDRRQAS